MVSVRASGNWAPRWAATLRATLCEPQAPRKEEPSPWALRAQQAAEPRDPSARSQGCCQPGAQTPGVAACGISFSLTATLTSQPSERKGESKHLPTHHSLESSQTGCDLRPILEAHQLGDCPGKTLPRTRNCVGGQKTHVVHTPLTELRLTQTV